MDTDRYGKYDFGRHCLLARRLLEKGITFVQVTHSNYDTHNENFNFHIEQLGEFDRAFACLVNDLAERGMLDSTLIVVLSEFGRTPGINLYFDPLNRLMLNWDFWRADEGGPSEHSFKAMLQFAF